MTTKTIEWWLRYDWSGASSRYRALQYFDELEQHGWRSSARSLAPFEGTGRARQAMGVVTRLAALASTSRRTRPHVAVVQKELLMPALLGRRIAVERLTSQPLVWDIDDAIWEVDEQRKRQASNLVACADAVVAGSPVLAEWCERTGAKSVELIPTCTRVAAELPARDPANVVIAWVGSATTAPYLHAIGPVLAAILDENPSVEFEAIGGALPPALQGHDRAISHWWSPEAEDALLQRAAVGVSPAPRTPFADGKCGFKVVQYAAHGLAVVATDSPTHRFLLDQAGTLASSDQQWHQALTDHIRDAARRNEAGAANWKRACTSLSTEVGAAQWSKVLASVS